MEANAPSNFSFYIFKSNLICIFAPSLPKVGWLHKNHSSNIGMYLAPEKKAEIFEKHGGSATNTGSTEGQIALFTYRISHLTEHLKKNRKDYGTQRSLQLLVGKRRSLLDYLKRKDIEKYRALVKELGLRR
jgi:small subunit ribosomal protein S15